MLNGLFSDVFSDSTKAVLSIGPFLACTVISLLLGFCISRAYSFRTAAGKSFVQTLVLLPAIVQVIIMLVNGNIGTGVAVAGTFTLVRFRSAPGGAKEIGSVFLAMAAGLATGMGYLGAAVLFTVLLCLVMVLLTVLNYGNADVTERILKITIPENLDQQEVFTDIFERYTVSRELTSVRTANLGSLYKLNYRVKLKPDINEKAFLDDLRCRNGNLEISCSRIPESGDSL